MLVFWKSEVLKKLQGTIHHDLMISFGLKTRIVELVDMFLRDILQFYYLKYLNHNNFWEVALTF